MQNVPKFVLKRLRETPLADSHPDADLLTAFAEQSLPGRERAVVMEHLAVCGDCRDVVALALPAIEIIGHTAAAGGSTRAGWLRLPSLRWGALAAGVAAVISVGVLQYTHRLQEKTVASNVVQKYAAPQTTAALTTPHQSQAPTAHREMQSKEFDASASRMLKVNKAAPEAKRVVQPPTPAAPAGTSAYSVGAGIGSGTGGGLAGKSFLARSGPGQAASSNRGAVLAQGSPSPTLGAPVQRPAPEIRQQVAVGGATETVEVSGAAPAIETESSVTLPQNQIAQAQADLPLQGRNVTSLDVVKAKDADANALHGSAAKQSVPSPSMPLQTSPALMLRASPRWTITSAGALQRSFDGGNTWENVNPSLSSASMTSESVVVEATAAPERVSKEKVDKNAAYRGAATLDKKNQKAEASPNPNPVFRAVAASGLEVWAGGSAGILFHTTDGGGIWMLVTPSSGGAILTGDIVNIQFSDTQHGRVATSTPELWTTSDGGRTWQKQP